MVPLQLSDRPGLAPAACAPDTQESVLQHSRLSSLVADGSLVALLCIRQHLHAPVELSLKGG